MANSAIATPVAQQLASNIKNADGTTSIYSLGAWTYKNAAGTTTFSVSDAGAVTAGPSGKVAFFGDNTSTSNVVGIYANCKVSTGNRANRHTASTANGGAIEFPMSGNDTTNSIVFYSNQTADGTSDSADVVGGVTPLGTWTFPVSVSVTGTADVSGTSAALRTDGGCYVAKIMSAGTVTDRTPFPEDLQTAIDAVNSMEKLPEGEYDSANKEKQLDHSRLHPYLRSGDHRDLSATVSCLVVYCRELSAQVTSLQAEVAALKA